jgi:hypothetical protein
MSSLSKLPAVCYSILLSDGSLIKIHRGESGYYPMKRHGERVYGDEARSMADQLNAAAGVTPQQEQAMSHGSIFGWDCPAADPDNEINSLPSKSRKIGNV